MNKLSIKKLETALITYLLMAPSMVLAKESYVEPIFGCREDANPLGCWVSAVFSWSQNAVLVLAVAVIMVAGAIYMTSAGNTERIKLSKKLIVGALTGVGVLILGKFFIVYVVGLEI